MSPAETVEFVGAMANIASKVPDAVAKIHDWLKGDGEPPFALLDELPSFAKNHLEHAAMVERARKAGTIP